MPRKKRAKIAALLILLSMMALLAKIAVDTLSDPTIMRTRVVLPGLDPASAPIRIALVSDLHVAGPFTPPERIARMVSQINALHPDVVAIAGDMIGEAPPGAREYTPAEIVSPLAGLRSRYGIYVVAGNHDHYHGLSAFEAQYKRFGLTYLGNSAAQAGPLVIGGMDDAYSHYDKLPATLAAMERLRGGRLVLTHSPDRFPALPPDVTLMLAGHTHCGQIAYPWGGAPVSQSRYGNRYLCGRIDENGHTLIVGPGIGTSILPIRLFTHPEIWLIELVGKPVAPAQ